MYPLLHLLVRRIARRMPRRDDRGDVPGWVFVTVMTAGLCAVLYQVAGGQLTAMLSDALNKVK